MSLETYFDHYNRSVQGASELRNTFDIDFRHHLTTGLRHNIVWGLGYRITADQTTPGGAIAYIPADKADNLFSLFIQDEIRLNNVVSLTLGSKLEHNPYTGFEYEPGAQLVWHPTVKQQVWISIARAIRQPARADTGIQVTEYSYPLTSGGTASVEELGTPNQPSERFLTYEAGYRNELTRKLSLDATVFFSSIHNLISLFPGQPFAVGGNPDDIVIPSYFRDDSFARTYGAELYGTWAVSSRLNSTSATP